MLLFDVFLVYIFSNCFLVCLDLFIFVVNLDFSLLLECFDLLFGF